MHRAPLRSYHRSHLGANMQLQGHTEGHDEDLGGHDGSPLGAVVQRKKGDPDSTEHQQLDIRNSPC